MKPMKFKNIKCVIKVCRHSPVWKWLGLFLILCGEILFLTGLATLIHASAGITTAMIILIAIPPILLLIQSEPQPEFDCDIEIDEEMLTCTANNTTIHMPRKGLHISYAFHNQAITFHHKHAVCEKQKKPKNIYISMPANRSVVTQLKHRGYGILVAGFKTARYERGKKH